MRQDSRGPQYPMVATSKHHCLTPRCRGVVNKKTEKSPYCYRCRWAHFKERNPLRYSFGNLRRRAKQRGKDFSLSFEQYKAFAIRTDYARMKGKTSLSLSIDRKENSKGYSLDNIQALTLRANSRKQFVKFFAHQVENQAYKPSEDELAEVESKI